MRRFLQLVVVLVPLGLFALFLEPVQQRLFGGQATQGILLLLGALTALVLVEVLLFRYWILPGWSEKLAERLYAGSYLPENDPLACLVEQINAQQDVSALPALELLVRKHPQRVRGWLELARLQLELADDALAALLVLDQGASLAHDAEDAALLSFRAARMCEKYLHDTESSTRRLLQLAARYPHTVYGRKALTLLPAG